MKGKFRKILGVGLVLALVLSLSLVMAAPVPAASPTDTDVGFLLGRADANDTVEWADNSGLTTELPAGGLGNYSVLLVEEQGTGAIYNYVQLIPTSGTTLSDLEALTNDWGFWYYLDETDLTWGPQLELKFTDPNNSDYFVDITVMAAQYEFDRPQEEWVEITLSDALENVGYWGKNEEGGDIFEDGDNMSLSAALVQLEGLVSDDTLQDWELTRVQVQLYENAPARTCYVDDITIDGTTYELEPIFLDAEYYSVGDTVEVTVPNFKANTDPIRVNPVTGEGEEAIPNTDWEVSVISTHDTLGTTVALEETGADTGVFTASFTTVDTLPAAEDELYVQDGDTLVGWGAVEVSSTALTALVDDTVPTITVVSPTDGQQISDRKPLISATYVDGTSDINSDSAEMFLDDEEVDATATTSGVTYTPTEDLVDGSYDVTVNVSDNAGNEATESWSFRVVSWLVDPVSGDGPDLDELDTVGVAVSGAIGTNVVIEVGRYASNPEPDAALTFSLIENGFFDVKLTGDAWTATQIVIKFADDNITADSVAYFWGDIEQEWIACSDQGTTADYLWVKVRDDTIPNITELTGTPFGISGEPEEFDPWIYDVNDDDAIQKTEALAAIADYFDLERTKAEALEVIALYFG
ncbi:hypothetical protein ES703_91369 [subsurface metagenome]